MQLFSTCFNYYYYYSYSSSYIHFKYYHHHHLYNNNNNSISISYIVNAMEQATNSTEAAIIMYVIKWQIASGFELYIMQFMYVFMLFVGPSICLILLNACVYIRIICGELCVIKYCTGTDDASHNCHPSQQIPQPSIIQSSPNWNDSAVFSYQQCLSSNGCIKPPANMVNNWCSPNSHEPQSPGEFFSQSTE